MELIRYAEKGGVYFIERHVLKADPSGFDVSGTNYKVVVSINPMYDATPDPTTHPHTYSLASGVTEKTQAEYDTEINNQLAQRAIDRGDYETAQQLDQDNTRIFLIDFYGKRYKKAGSSKRDWFNKRFGFDPVDDDPRT